MFNKTFRDDSYYVRKVLKGDRQAFAVLVDKHKSMAFKLAMGIAKNKEDAEEIAQDSFLKAFEALPKFNADSKFSTWLYRIVYNTAISKIRKKKVLHDDIDDTTISTQFAHYFINLLYSDFNL